MSIFDQGARLVPDIVTEAEERRILMRVADAPWLSDLSRRVQHYGYRYSYTSRNAGRHTPAPAFPRWAIVIADRLRPLFDGVLPEQCIVNEYRSGHATLAIRRCRATLPHGFEFDRIHAFQRRNRIGRSRGRCVLCVSVHDRRKWAPHDNVHGTHRAEQLRGRHDFVQGANGLHPKLEGFTGVIDAILEADRDERRKQRHTAQRIFERLRDEHGE